MDHDQSYIWGLIAVLGASVVLGTSLRKLVKIPWGLVIVGSTKFPGGTVGLGNWSCGGGLKVAGSGLGLQGGHLVPGALLHEEEVSELLG